MLAHALAWLALAAAVPDRSLEDLIRRLRAGAEASRAELQPRIERIVGGLEALAQPPAPELLAALQAELDALGSEASVLLVLWLDPGAAPAPAAAFRAEQIADGLARRELAPLDARLVELTRAGSTLGRRNAARLLGVAGTPAALARLHELFDGSAPELRRIAAPALAVAGAGEDAGARAAFLERALADPDPELVGAVVQALAAHPDASARGALTGLLERPAAAAPWIEPILASLAALAPLPEEDLARLVGVALDDRWPREARARVLESLARSHAPLPRGQEKRIETLAREVDAPLREPALLCLARLGDRSARREILRIHDDVVAKNDRWPPAYQRRAEAWLSIGEPRNAAQDYRRAIDLVRAQGRQPGSELWIALARSCLRDGRAAQAYDALLEGRVTAAELAPLADDADFRALREHPRYGRVFSG